MAKHRYDAELEEALCKARRMRKKGEPPQEANMLYGSIPSRHKGRKYLGKSNRRHHKDSDEINPKVKKRKRAPVVAHAFETDMGIDSVGTHPRMSRHSLRLHGTPGAPGRPSRANRGSNDAGL
ncbi:hypothetical protein HAX54_028561 [Datura stramonium]|uniref:Uncharacterized protein n=1 Tax=Datura stramonium TaxID=4076 RepID=A0ABS8S9N6_DATST|nr:hypothetical protein [Datura stramonium]